MIDIIQVAIYPTLPTPLSSLSFSLCMGQLFSTEPSGMASAIVDK